MAGVTSIFTSKRALLDQANKSIVIIAGVAAFITVFCLVSTKTLIGQANYQNKVIKAENTTYTTLTSDINAENQLNASYEYWETKVPNPGQNIIGGSSTASGFNDGDNAQIILHALPTQYDFPALLTNMSDLMTLIKLSNPQVSGQDQQLVYQTQTTSATPKPTAIPFELTATGDYQTIVTLISALQNTIRPIQVLDVNISGTSANLTVNIQAQTYYQPSVLFQTSQEVISSK